jgi:hypothetical protein
MTTTMQRTQPRSSVRRAAPWVAGVWTLAFGALSVLALLGRTSDPWVPDAASPLSGLSSTQMSWTLAVAALLVLVAGAAGAVSRERFAQRRAGWLLIGLGLVVALVISDVRALTFLGYLPQILVALVGVGPMAGHLAKAGHRLTVYNRSIGKAKRWSEAYGGSVAVSPAKAAEDADIVISCVGTDDDLSQITLGREGAFRTMKPGGLFIDHTTVSARIARQLFVEGESRSLHCVDAPVSGELKIVCTARFPWGSIAG